MPIRFAPSSIRFLDGQPDNVRSKLINDVVWLRDHHAQLTLERYLAAPVVIDLFRDSYHWILFYVEAGTMMVANIGDSGEDPHLWRPASLL